MPRSTEITGIERFFDKDEVIVSKTDSHGTITYANRPFLAISGYTEAEVVGKPHNIIRHPDMPRCVFKLLWDTIRSGREIFAYVVNRCKSGDHYWVLAHVTPSFDPTGRLVGYHSNRRVPDRPALENVIMPLYRSLLDTERRSGDPKAGLEASHAQLAATLERKGVDYDRFVFSL
jgi:PAS domain S-box-containing protein